MKSFLYQNYILNKIQHPNHDIIGLEKKNANVVFRKQYNYGDVVCN